MAKKVLLYEGLNILMTGIKSGEIAVGRVKEGGIVPASTIQGVISLANIPKGAQERLVIVPNETARKALTKEQIQAGDTCKEMDTGKMYYVVDDSKLATDEGWEVYSAGSAVEASHSKTSDTATKAINDSEGNNIAATYLKSEDLVPITESEIRAMFE